MEPAYSDHLGCAIQESAVATPSNPDLTGDPYVSDEELLSIAGIIAGCFSFRDTHMPKAQVLRAVLNHEWFDDLRRMIYKDMQTIRDRYEQPDPGPIHGFSADGGIDMRKR